MSKSKGYGRFVLRACTDFFGLFAPITGAPKHAWQGNGKRILILNWRDQKHEYAGGAEVYIHELAKRLAAEGNLVTFFCGSDGRGAAKHETIDGVHIVRRGGFWFVYIWAFLYYMLRFRKKYDVIVDCHNGIPFFTPLFAREPVICIVHHVHQEVFKNHLPKPLAAFACFLEKKLMPRAYNRSQFVAVSPSTQREMQDGLGIQGDIQIIYNGVRLDVLKPGQKSQQPLVLFLGRLQKYKSVDVAIRAFKEVLATVPQARMVIAGDGDARKDLQALAKKEGLQKQITFTGKVTDADKQRLLQEAWLMVNPSFMEGWGLTTIEANACATPVIGSDVPGLRDSIQNGKTGRLVPYGNDHALASEVAQLLSDHHQRRTLADQAHTWAQGFHWDVSATRLRGLIRQELEPVSYSKATEEVNA